MAITLVKVTDPLSSVPQILLSDIPRVAQQIVAIHIYLYDRSQTLTCRVYFAKPLLLNGTLCDYAYAVTPDAHVMELTLSIHELQHALRACWEHSDKHIY